MSEDKPREGEAPHREHRERRSGPLRDFARRLLTEPEPSDAPHEDRGRMDARDMLGAFLETGDKAKTEVVRMIAREVRAYLEALEVGEDIHDLLTNYSLEVHASLHLRPLREDERQADAEAGQAGARLRRKRKKAESEDEAG